MNKQKTSISSDNIFPYIHTLQSLRAYDKNDDNRYEIYTNKHIILDVVLVFDKFNRCIISNGENYLLRMNEPDLYLYCDFVTHQKQYSYFRLREKYIKLLNMLNNKNNTMLTINVQGQDIRADISVLDK